jgi:hypothetical protein
MASLFSWIRECFNYVFSKQVKTELISMINGYQIDTNTRENMIQSIMKDNPKQLSEQIAESNLPKINKEELMMSIMRASQMYANPIVNEETKKEKHEIKIIEPVENEITYTHDEMLYDENNEKNNVDCMRKYEIGNNYDEEPIYDYEETGEEYIQPREVIGEYSEQDVEYIYADVQKIEHEDEYADMPELISDSESSFGDESESEESEYNYHMSTSTPLPEVHAVISRQLLDDEVYEYTPVVKYVSEEVIHTGKIIPSDQFVPISSNIQVVKYYEPTEYVLDPERMYQRVIESEKLRDFIKRERKENKLLSKRGFVPIYPLEEIVVHAPEYMDELVQCEYNNSFGEPEVIHTGKIIPSDQFVPIETPRYYNIDIDFRPYCSMTKDWKKSFDLVLNQLKFKQFIKEKRAEAKQYKEDIRIHETREVMNSEFKFDKVISEIKKGNELVVKGKSIFKDIILKNKRDERRRLIEELEPYTKNQQNKMHSRKHHSPIAKMHKRNNVMRMDHKWKQDM